MKRRTAKRSGIAILSVCVWALFVLFASFAARPTGKAQAESLMDREILIWATDLNSPSGGGSYETYEFGSFYRGMGVLSEVSFQPSGNGQGGTIEWDDIDYDNGEVLLTISDTSDPLYDPDQDRHNFTDGAEFENKDEHTHWAVCPDCGFKLQVAHRPDDTGTCKDCGEELGDDYINTYTFTVPDIVPDPDNPVDYQDENTLTFDISLAANLYAGTTLTLFVQCENGTFISENGESIDYTVSAADEQDYGTAEEDYYNASELIDEPLAIWVFTVEEETEYDGTDDSLRKIIGNLTITITLTVDVYNAIADLVYSGTFTDTLTFTASLETGAA